MTLGTSSPFEGNEIGNPTQSSPTPVRRENTGLPRPCSSPPRRRKRRSLRRILLVALSWALLASACGRAERDRSDSKSIQEDPASDELTSLPVEPLLFPGADKLIALQDAYNRLVGECMTALGYTYEPDVVLPPPELMNPIEPHRRYGDISVEQATDFGYRNPFAEYERAVADRNRSQERVPAGYFEALTGEPSLDPDTGQMRPSEEGCAPTATRTVFGNSQGLEGLPGYEEILRVQEDSFSRAAVDDGVKAAERGWSDCMLAEGFRFSSSAAPLEQWASAVDDDTPPTADERSVAIADASCRDSAGLFEAWLQAESGIQVKMLEGMPEQVQLLQNAIDQALRNATLSS